LNIEGEFFMEVKPSMKTISNFTSSFVEAKYSSEVPVKLTVLPAIGNGSTETLLGASIRLKFNVGSYVPISR